MAEHTKTGAVSFKALTPYAIVEFGEIKGNRHVSTNLADAKQLIIRGGRGRGFSDHDEQKKKQGREKEKRRKERRDREEEKRKSAEFGIES